MAGQCSNDSPSASSISAECSDSTVQLNIKTLDSHIYSFQVDKNMPVSLLKEKVANETGIPVVQQRLIFRGKVLKDDHILSEYHVENGDTLHLVERQLNQSQAPGTSSGETTGTNGNRGNDAGSGAPRNRVGQISHSVVLGTFNVGDQGDGVVPDLSRVIGAVLNSIGIGGQSTSGVTNVMQSSSSIIEFPFHVGKCYIAPCILHFISFELTGYISELEPNPSIQGSSGNGTEGMPVGNQNHSGNQAQSGQTFSSQPFQSLPQVVQIPLAAGSITIPSLNAPIPDSLDTLAEFINRMEQTLSQNGYQPNFSSTNAGEQTRVELPSNPQGLPTVEALSTVLHRAERLLGGRAVAALSHIAGRLEREGTTSDQSIRGQIQSESMQIGLAMQHLGAFLLELGRTILTLRMGQSSAESAVNAGPAVYISPSGPNPIMVQPFPLQTSSLFGGSVPSTPATFGAVGVGNPPRNVNIHIHAGTSLAPIVSAIGSRPNNGEGVPNERRNAPGSADLGSTRVLPVRNIIAAAVPARAPGVGVGGSTQPSLGVSTSQPPSDSVSLSSVLAEVNSRIRNLVGNTQGDNTVLSGQVESTNQDLSVGSESRPTPGNEQVDTRGSNGVGAASVSSVGCSSASGVTKPQPEAVQTNDNEGRDGLSSKSVSTSSNQDSLSCSSGETVLNPKNAQSDSGKHHSTASAKAAPLGLGMGGLERKRRTRVPDPVGKGTDDGSASSSSNQNQQARTSGQHILQALASHGTSMNQRNANVPPQGSSSPGDGQIDVAGVMSQVLHSPALNGLLAGVSQQTGVGSPNDLRNMLEQFTQSPQMRNTVNQIVQQVGSQDMGNMFAGMEREQSSGFDLSRMFQQMMPIVSQALGGGSPSQPFSSAGRDPQAPYRDGTLSRDENSGYRSLQINLQPVAERIEHLSPPADVFRAVVENAIQLYGSGNSSDSLLDELCSDEGLASVSIPSVICRLYLKILNDLVAEPKGADCGVLNFDVVMLKSKNEEGF
ncbi:ubiquitin-like domain-containing protein CIP73 isoform X1 [Senna tora]|uniref:Ubiquitin-like domain-containing protein CIP73 isoform X1 n=1 Tax=Senna tora TaxID=362788 RepID=A0A834WSG2_9FABA|nr:ubiquitin-like domain-containing protein CIP73 isoform X1 [Senna tora]